MQDIRTTTASFASGAKSIPVDVYLPETPGSCPAVLLLHGADGMAMGGMAYRQSAEALAGQGYAVFQPHYFHRTGNIGADLPTIVRYAIPWMETVGHCADYAAAQQGVDGTRMALAGASLGAYLALTVASQDLRYLAVVEYFGGIADQVAPFISRMPPVLILHGDADDLVPVSEAYKLEEHLKRLGTPYEMKIYHGEGHGFLEPAASDAVRRSLDFLNRHLKKSVREAPSP